MKLIIAFLMILIFATSIPCQAWAEHQKTKIAILDFPVLGKGSENTDMGKTILERLTRILEKDGRFELLDTRQIENALHEHNLVMNGLKPESDPAQLGHQLGLKAIILGSVIRYRNVMQVNARIVNPADVSIIASESERMINNAGIPLDGLISRLAQKIRHVFPLDGYIVHRDGKSVTIDIGKNSGIKPDMRYGVFEKNLVKQPVPINALNVMGMQTGTIEIKNVSENLADAMILNEKALDAIEYGQKVKFVDFSEKHFGQRKAKRPVSKQS